MAVRLNPGGGELRLRRKLWVELARRTPRHRRLRPWLGGFDIIKCGSSSGSSSSSSSGSSGSSRKVIVVCSNTILVTIMLLSLSLMKLSFSF